jgi:hypothetical protein
MPRSGLAEDGVDEISGAQCINRISKRPDAGEDELVGVVDLLGGIDDLRSVADRFKGLLNGTEVGHVVVEDCDGHCLLVKGES